MRMRSASRLMASLTVLAGLILPRSSRAQTVSVFDVLAATETLTVIGTTTFVGGGFSVGTSSLVLVGGAVGIGTASPMDTLHVSGGDIKAALATSNSQGSVVVGDGLRGDNYTGIFRSEDLTGGSNAFLSLGGYDGIIFFASPDQLDLQTERMRIVAGTGFIGIGTDTPTSLLHISSGALTVDGSGGNITSVGTIKSGQGFVFPDNSIQTTAAVDSAWQSTMTATTGYVFTVPAGSSMVYVTMCGGGGGGGAGSWGAAGYPSGAGGSSGVVLGPVAISVSHSTAIYVSAVGSGGSGGPSGQDSGSPGGNTTIYFYNQFMMAYTTYTAYGGAGGNGSAAGGGAAKSPTNFGSLLSTPTNGTGSFVSMQPYFAAAGGGGAASSSGAGGAGAGFMVSGGTAGGTSGGGGGGSSPWGMGGAGSASSSGGNATGYCAGGGGGYAMSYGIGGAGTSGLVVFSWIGPP